MTTKKNQVRIIAGDWRGRKIHFPDAEGLRPTADRLRETLFNWLQLKIRGKNCLDAFAGSGAIGFEAASRGAQHVTLVEKSPLVAKQLIENSELLMAKNIEIKNQDALSFLKITTSSYDLIFLDPPFELNLLEASLRLIRERSLLNAEGIVYIEYQKHQTIEELSHWSVLKKTQMGQVIGTLLSFN